MPKAIQYRTGSIIYFSGDVDDRIFILQKGQISLKSIDIATGCEVHDSVNIGEFFGVKSALGHFPREETVSAVKDSVCIVLTVAEFEQTFGSNKGVILKMLKVFSGQLRNVHKKINAILRSDSVLDQPSGMQAVAQSFFDDKQYKTCCDVCAKFFARFPQAANVNQVKELYLKSKKLMELSGQNKPRQAQAANGKDSGDKALKQFALPAFERFAKTFEEGSVIIAEYEPGDCFYLLQSGKVQLVKCINGAKKNLDILQPGEFFGEMAILDNSPRSATCVAAERVQVLEFNKQNFEVLIMGNPQLAIILLKLFCKRIYDQNKRLKILTLRDPQARIGNVFLMIDEMNPPANPNVLERRLNLTISDISHWAGLPIETVNAGVKFFTEKHKIERFDNYFVIKNIIDFRRFIDQQENRK